jgi:4-amino-4-deoxy-L-arabinose transferase-like glycosyltransferase
MVATLAPLSPDEAYYWVWSRALAPGYLDHPPMVALWIRAGTAITGGSLGVRLLAPLAAGLGTLLLADAAERLLPGRRAGQAAALALNATLLFGAGAVTMTPDTPLLFFWTATLWGLARFATSPRRPVAWLLAAGLAAGLALCSKYTAAFLGLGAAGWFVLVPTLRPWLRRPWPWLAGVIALGCFAPVLAWNAAHGWASLLRQGGRVGQFNAARAARFLAELLVGQIGLATPLLAMLLAAGIVLAVRAAWRTREAGWTLLALLSVPPLLVFVQHALGDRVQANWPAIAYPAAAIAAAGLTAPVWRRLRVPALTLGFALAALVYVQAALAPVALSPHLDPTMRQLAGWRGLAAQVNAARMAVYGTFIVADDYGVAAELARALPRATIIGAGPRWALFDLPHPDLAGRVGILVRSARHADPPDPAGWAELTPLPDAVRGRDGIIAETFRLYRARGGEASPDLAELPHGDPRP